MINIANLSVTLGEKKILKEIDLSVRKGELFGLIGPNGSGKTTLLKTLAKLIPFEQGNIQILGKDQMTYKHKEMARILSYVPQDTMIDFDFNVKDIVAMGRHAHRSFFNRHADDEVIIKQAMMDTNTWRFIDKSISNLSSGQRQLVFIAKALAQDTPIILLDEPIAALDIYYQIHILKLLKSLTKKGKTVIIVLHDLNLAARFCNRLFLLKEGKIKSSGSIKNVLTKKTLKETYHIDATIRVDDVIKSINITAL